MTRICLFLAALLVFSAGMAPAAEEEVKDNSASAFEELLEAQPDDQKDADADQPTEKPADADENADQEKQPLNMWADQIIYEGDSFTCTGNVIVTHGTSRIECDKVVGTIADQEKEKNGKITVQKAITYLEATGSPIIMTSSKRTAKCQKAVYNLLEGTVVLTGTKENPPQIKDDKRWIQGQRIVFDLKKQSVSVDSAEGALDSTDDDKKRPSIQIPLDGSDVPEILE